MLKKIEKILLDKLQLQGLLGESWTRITLKNEVSGTKFDQKLAVHKCSLNFKKSSERFSYSIISNTSKYFDWSA